MSSGSNVESSRTLAGSPKASSDATEVTNEAETPVKRMSPRRAAGKNTSTATVIKGGSGGAGAAVADASADSGASASRAYPETVQKKRKGAPVNLVTPNRDDDEMGTEGAPGVAGADDPVTPSKADEDAEKGEGTNPDPETVMGEATTSPQMNSSPPMDSTPLQGEIQKEGVNGSNSTSVATQRIEPAVESPMRTNAEPARPKEVPADTSVEGHGGDLADRPLKRRKVMLCAGAAVVAMATLFASESFRGVADTTSRDAMVLQPTKPSPLILFRSTAPKAAGRVGVGMPASLIKDVRSPSRTPTRRLGGGGGGGDSPSALPRKERQPAWNTSFLSGFLSPSDGKVDPKREVTVRPLSSFSPFTAQRDVLRTVVVDEKKAVAVVPAKRPSEVPNKGPGRWKRLAEKFREAATHAAKGAADAVAGASPMSHLQE